MWKEIKALSQIVIKSCLIIGLLFGSYEYLNRVFINRDVYHGETFHSLPQNSMDVLVLGSSHAQYSFIPSFFYQETGLYSFVLGSACQPLEVSYEMLKEALKTQKPSLLLLEVFTAMPLHQQCMGNSCYVLAEYQMTGEEKYNTINYLPEEERKEYLNDFINYHNDWKTITDFSVLLPKNVLYKDRVLKDNNFGYIFQAAVLPVENWWYPLQHDEQEVQDTELEKRDLESLNKIYALCKENGIELYLYKTPIDSYTEENYYHLHAVWKWAEENGIEYTDFCEEAEDLDYSLWIMGDSNHAYINGAGLITHVLADRLKEYPTKHVSNSDLDQRYDSNGNGYTTEYLRYEFNPSRILERLSRAGGVIVVRYNAQRYTNESVINGMIKILNKEFDETQDYYAYLIDGRIIKEANEPFAFEANGHNYDLSEDDLQYDGESTGNKGPLSLSYSFNDSFPVVHNISLGEQSWEIGYDYYTKKQ